MSVGKILFAYIGKRYDYISAGDIHLVIRMQGRMNEDECMHEHRHGRMGNREWGIFGGLRNLVLDVLSEKAMRGSEIMEETFSRSMGRWRPSPGTIYPLLSSLEREGFVMKLEDGRYELTQSGKDELSIKRSIMQGFSPFSRPKNIDDMINDIDSYLNYFADLENDMVGYKEKLAGLSNKLNSIVGRIK